MTLHKENKLVRFTWVERRYYFEFRITQDELTGDVSLIITDFADEDEIEETKGLWNNQIADLKHMLGFLKQFSFLKSGNYILFSSILNFLTFFYFPFP
jgi:hypothetical protein